MERSIIFTVALSIAALLFVLELVRRRKLREEYSLLWLFTALVMIVVSVWRELLHGLATLFGIAYPPNLLFLLAALLTFLILLYYSVIITRLTHENKVIAQEVALLRYEIEQLRSEQANADKKPPATSAKVETLKLEASPLDTSQTYDLSSDDHDD
ncbi:DUF2304 domain-containing protein [Phototrophicus methaneseepsis]|uniref:DUF2304 domain-containing protein n=1 Tax=Phototrophicus methaneseepsis TaxID=2710758 RepID=A0A7S8IEZ5_9CHLR|nr:DUF2304 domain-containing protein [Phototrophicus methaneseepsis]QPC82979.1 DUF2304 domain-containing protein [Phototrophicus methaneseepsis]